MSTSGQWRHQSGKSRQRPNRPWSLTLTSWCEARLSEYQVGAKQECGGLWYRQRPLNQHSRAYGDVARKFNRCLLSSIVPPGGSFVEQARSLTDKAASSENVVNHGGVVCVARSGLTLTKLDLKCKPKSFEVLCVRIRSANSMATSVLSIIYRPGSKPPNEEFFDELSTHIESLAGYSCPVYITGDFNIQVEDKTTNIQQRYWKFTDLRLDPTRPWADTSTWRNARPIDPW